MKIYGFITNFGKYNEGYLMGKWVEFPIEKDELNDALKEIGCTYENENGNLQNPLYEEYFFSDWECDVDLGLGEYVSIEELNEIAERLSGLSEYDEKIFKAALEYSGDFEKAIEINNWILLDDVRDDYELGYYWIEESGYYDLSNMGNLSNYIDYESFGRDFRLESDGDFTGFGWIERG